MKLSIVIPAFNEEKLLPQTLAAVRAALSALEAGGILSEVIVCDNNSTDRTAELAREAGALVVFEPVNQIGRARNAGAAVATGDWILFLDADSTPCPGLFRELSDVLTDSKVIGGGCTMRVDLPPGAYRLVVGLWNFYSKWSGRVAGAFLFCRTEAFREIGGFSTTLFASEELDLSNRLISLGRSRGQRMKVLRRHSLLTSARKRSLYRTGEVLRFCLQTVVRRGRNLQSRESCAYWYDGRR